MIVFATNLTYGLSNLDNIVIKDSLLWCGVSVQQRGLLIWRKMVSDGKANVIPRSIRLVCRLVSVGDVLRLKVGPWRIFGFAEIGGTLVDAT
jgi:hypothetical protein